MQRKRRSHSPPGYPAIHKRRVLQRLRDPHISSAERQTQTQIMVEQMSLTLTILTILLAYAVGQLTVWIVLAIISRSTDK